jgi:hypothetical protein
MRPEIALHLPVGGDFFAENALEQLNGGVEEDRFGHRNLKFTAKAQRAQR